MSRFTKPAPAMPISDETALAQVQSFTEFYGIDPDTKSDPDGADATEKLLSDMHRFIRLGWLEVGPDLKVTQHLQAPPGDVREVIYRKVLGADTIAAEKNSGSSEYHDKIFKILESIGDAGTGVRKLTGSDLKVAEVLGTLFFSR